MTPEQKVLVQQTWAKVVPIAATAADLFYTKLFTLDPGLRPLFARTDLGAQKHKLVATLNVAIAGLDDVPTLVGILTELGRRHVGYGVTESQYPTVGAALLWTLEQGLGPAFTPAVKAAWTAVYGVVAETMIAGMRSAKG